MNAYDGISTIFGFLSEVQRSSRKLRILFPHNPDNMEDTLAAELIQFAAFLRTQKPVTVSVNA